MDDSLKKNIALGLDDEQVDINRLHQAIEQAQLSDLVEQLPYGLDNIVGERGIRLSGGQRQRIALARAFYHGRNVLVMDEATSALDNKTEEEIVDQIRRLKGQITTIIIAHRHSTYLRIPNQEQSQHCQHLGHRERKQRDDRVIIAESHALHR